MSDCSMENMNTAELATKLETVFNNKYDNLYSCAFRMTGNHHNTQDVLQNSFLKAYQNISKFRNESNLYTWLYKIVINESYRFLEYMDKLPLTSITEKLGVSEREFFNSIEYNPDFDDHLIIDEMREKCLQAFLKCMPKNQRVCFLLKTCLKLSNREIAEILDLSIANVKVTLHRGRNKLRELLEMRCNLIDPEKPCKCHLWIKYMREHHLTIPSGYGQIRNEELKKEHFRNLSLLRKIDYLYSTEPKYNQEDFMKNVKKLVEAL